MTRLMLFLRNHFHPLFFLRQFAVFRRATQILDVPIAIRFKDIAHPVHVSFSKNLSWVLTGGASIEEGERKNFIWLVKEGGFRQFVDVGANIGLYGFIFGSIAKDGIVTLIEPDPSNVKLIHKTIAASKLQVTLVQAATSNESGSVTFYKDDLTGATGSLVRSGKDSFITVHHKQKPCAISVRAITLDELFPVDSADLIKIDVEGAELKTLRGGEAMLSRSHPALMFECDQDQEVISVFLQRHGYHFFDMETLASIDAIPHNCLALHEVKHATIVAAIVNREQSPSINQ